MLYSKSNIGKVLVIQKIYYFIEKSIKKIIKVVSN